MVNPPSGAFIPILGYVDDVLLLPLLIGLTVKLLPADVLAERRDRADEWMRTHANKPRSPAQGSHWWCASVACGVRDRLWR